MTIAAPAPSHWRAIAYPRRPRRRPRHLDALWLRAQGPLVRLAHRAGSYLDHADRVLALEREFSTLDDGALARATDELRARFRMKRETNGDLDRALALARELAHRRLGMRPYRVQIGAALALLDGCIAELATGEGKTLVASMAATIQGWRGRGCHVVTANDYLAARDATWMRPLYESLGIVVASVTQTSAPDERISGYAADVTYTTNREVAADFLRDRLTLGPDADLTSALGRRLGAGARSDPAPLLLRGLSCAIVDEADSVLIDDAVTPLILSGSGDNHAQADAYASAARVAARLEPDRDYRSDPRRRDVELTGAGLDRIDALTSQMHGLWRAQRRREELIIQALVAREHFHRDVHYIISDGRIVIIDESTGRTLPDRTWRAGLHQAIEARERLDIQPLRDTLARISFQRFFNRYEHLSGMTGTATEARAEFWTTYRRPVCVFPTHRPSQRRVLPALVTNAEDEKWSRVVAEIEREHAAARPVLVGTPSIKDSEHLSGLLGARGLAHRVLNARRHTEEASIVRQAGEPGRITVATNMAGRGTDIALAPGVADAGGLHVIATSFHDSARVDRQLIGRGARQGDPGSARMIASLDDALLERFARWGRRVGRFLPPSLRPAVFRFAQWRARDASRALRRNVLDADERLDEALAFAGVEH